MADPSENATSPPPSRSDRVLEIVERRSGRTTVGELADAVFRAEGGAESYEAVHEDLFCRVLPALDEWGQLRFDVDRGLVVLESGGRDSRLGRLREWLRG